MAEKTEYVQFTPEQASPEHDKTNSRFFIKIDKYEAVLEYAETSPGVLDLYHTDVPVPIQGRGLGKILALEAFEYVANNGLKMILSCSHLQKYYKDNPKPEYKNCVVINYTS